jgi:hypothetical protein
MPHKKNKNILFVSSLDKAILNKEDKITGYTKYKINQLGNGGCHISFATTHTEASLNRIFDGIHFQLPLITMNGTAIYQPKDKHYLSVDHIERGVRIWLDRLFVEKGVNAFCFTVDDDILQIYHGKLKGEAEIKYYRERRNNFFDNYVSGTAPEEVDACFYELIQPKSVIMDIVDEIQNSEYAQKLDLLYYEYEATGNYLLKISSQNSNKSTRLRELKEKTNATKVVVFGSGSSDIEMMKIADLSFCLKNAPDDVKTAATKVLDTDDPDAILKTIEKIYHIKDYSVYEQKIKSNS